MELAILILAFVAAGMSFAAVAFLVDHRDKTRELYRMIVYVREEARSSKAETLHHIEHLTVRPRQRPAERDRIQRGD